MTNHKYLKLAWLAVAAGVVFVAPAARAQTITTLSPTPTSGAGTTPAPVKSAPQSGVISAQPLPSTTAPEAINTSGTGTTTTTVSIDPNGGPTVVELYFDMSRVALKGAKSLAAYHTTGQGRITRVLAASDTYVATLPIWTTSAAGKTDYYTMTATFNMTFNTTTNVLTSISVAFGDYAPGLTAGSTSGTAIQ